MASGTASSFDGTITVHPYDHIGQATDNTYPCTCGQKAGKPPSLIGTSIPTDDPFTVECTQPPPGVNVQIDAPTDNPNAFICTQPTSLSDASFRVSLISPSAAPSIRLPQALGGSSVSNETLATGASGVLGVLFLLAVGSTLWYRQRYLQLLNGNSNSSRTGKSKRQ